MENASKALLIAGAVLIVILLIGIGMLIYSKSTGIVDTAASTMNTQEVQMFNSQFTAYEGEQDVSSVKSLIQAIIANNATHEGDTNKVVTSTIITPTNTTGGHTPELISQNVIKNLKSGSKYKVTFDYNENGYIRIIYLKEM